MRKMHRPISEGGVKFQVELGWGHQEKAAAHNIDQGGMDQWL